MFLHEGKDGQLVEEIGTACQGGKAHAGGIYGVCISISFCTYGSVDE